MRTTRDRLKGVVLRLVTTGVSGGTLGGFPALAKI